MPTLSNLKAYYAQTKPIRPDSLNLRLHRALSWLEVAEDTDDLDFKFIGLWIGFNAVYAKEVAMQSGDRTTFREFLVQVSSLDQHKKLHNALWERFSGNIRVLLNNRYIFAPFWEFHNGNITAKGWQSEFDDLNKKAFTSLMEKDVDGVLFVLFDRLYTLRNQIVHGGSTHDSNINREQVKDGCAILEAILPIIIEIVMINGDRDWGKPFYPVVD